MKEELVCMADIQNKIYEAGLFRPEEKVVLATMPPEVVYCWNISRARHTATVWWI